MSASRNRALELIVASYRDDLCAGRLLKAHPNLTTALHAEAEEVAAKIASGPAVELEPERRRLLRECVLDLELVSAFSVLREYTGDPALASSYVDAVVFEATGEEASGQPTEDEYRDLGTQRYRGIAKYSKSKDYFKVADPTAWLFAKEYAAICGKAKDVAYIAAILPLTLLIRAHGKWITRYWLTGQAPTDAEQNALAVLTEKAASGRDEMLGG